MRIKRRHARIRTAIALALAGALLLPAPRPWWDWALMQPPKWARRGEVLIECR